MSAAGPLLAVLHSAHGLDWQKHMDALEKLQIFGPELPVYATQMEMIGTLVVTSDRDYVLIECGSSSAFRYTYAERSRSTIMLPAETKPSDPGSRSATVRGGFRISSSGNLTGIGLFSFCASRSFECLLRSYPGVRAAVNVRYRRHQRDPNADPQATLGSITGTSSDRVGAYSSSIRDSGNRFDGHKETVALLNVQVFGLELMVEAIEIEMIGALLIPANPDTLLRDRAWIDVAQHVYRAVKVHPDRVQRHKCLRSRLKVADCERRLPDEILR
jgi:hypothetical protein